MTVARATGRIPSVRNGEDGKDAVWYEIVPNTFAVSLDANGDWADGTSVATLNGEECAQVYCTFIKHVGDRRESPEEYLVLLAGNRLLDMGKYSGFAYVKKTDTSADLSLHTFAKDNPPTYAGELLARTTISVNRAGSDGKSVYVDENNVTYGISNDPKNPGSVKTWASNIPSITADQPYLWAKSYVHFSDGTSTTSYSVTTRGNRGALFRQHMGLVDGDYSYQSGSGTEEFIDVVRMGNTWYRCISSYSSKDTPAANNVANTKYWSTSGMTNMDFVATQLLLAENATINMLGANEINLYDGEDMFGSFRVPHGKEGVDGDVDGGKYALWLGGKVAEGASFGVTKDGTVRSRSGTFTNVRTSGFFYKSKVVVDDSNGSEFFGKTWQVGDFYQVGFDFTKAGAWVEFDINTSLSSGLPSLSMPGIRPTVSSYTQESLDTARSFVGNQIILYNKGKIPISITGYCCVKEGDGGNSFALAQGEFAILECKLSVTDDKKEDIFWLWKRGTTHTAKD